MSENPLFYSNLRTVVLTLRALNHKFRQDLIQYLFEKPEGQILAQIVLDFEQDIQFIIANLAILKRSGIIEKVEKENQIFYLLNTNKIKEVKDAIELLHFSE